MNETTPSAEAVFLAALDIEGPEDRAAYLDAACPDPQLRRHVERLLALDARAGDFLEPAALSSTLTAAPTAPREAVGTVIGPYKLMEQIGEGGMGVVFVAEQHQPVRRKVALKVIRPGMDTKQVIARFEAERQALALMDHPNIAKVLDAGATPEGRPYFAMELVKGLPITRHCDERRMSVRERLELLVSVCQAVQHAHQKGIIHRDLKPSNVLVAPYDGVPIVKVIDFGVAKAAGQPLTERTLATGFGAVVGTLEYMSPEQAELNNLDIDTRSDIYSLGVLLYELLTGTTPLQKKLAQAAFTEVLRVIREEEPPRPSTRLSTTEELPSIAANRGAEPGKLTGLVRGELDWIVMKALEKDRNRRYETANGFAMDIQRYLADEPVLAGPPSAWYRLRKFVRRNKGLVLAVSLVVLALVGGIVGTTVGLVRAERAWKAEAGQRRTADEERAIARAVNDFLQDLLGQVDLENQPGGGGPDEPRDPEIMVRTVLDRAAQTVEDRFADQPRVEAAIRLTIAKAYQALGHYKEAQLHAERSVALRTAHLGAGHSDTLNSQAVLAEVYVDQGFMERAEALHREVLEKRVATLGADHLDTLTSKLHLASFYAERRDFDQAVALLQEVVQQRETQLGAHDRATLWSKIDLAWYHNQLGRHDLAAAQYVEVQKAFEGNYGRDHPGALWSKSNLALVYRDQGEYARAEPLLREALEKRVALQGSDHPVTLSNKFHLADVCYHQRKYDQAVPLLEEVIPAAKVKWGEDHVHTLRIMQTLACAYRDWGKPAQALPLIEQVLTKREKQEPDAWTTFYAKAMLGEALLGQKKYADAEPLLVQGYEGMKQREAKIPPQFRDMRIREPLDRLVQLYDAWDKPDQAAKWRKELERIKQPAEEPTGPERE
jgi:non-specific serine/threonine protein kinase/serine/threonine-protein kinase